MDFTFVEMLWAIRCQIKLSLESQKYGITSLKYHQKIFLLLPAIFRNVKITAVSIITINKILMEEKHQILNLFLGSNI